MKKKYLLFIICLLFLSNIQFAQKIIIGSDTLAVQSLKLPLWLDEGETIEPLDGVGFISVLDFFKDTANQNKLELESPIIIRSLQTVPVGKFWKIESIGVLDSYNTTGSSSSSGGGSVVSRTSIYDFTMISNQSTSYYYIADACAYCDTLTENGFTDWILPSDEEWLYLTAGGATNSFVRNGTWLMLRTVTTAFGNYNFRRVWGTTLCDLYAAGANSGCSTPATNLNNCPQYVRCVR